MKLARVGFAFFRSIGEEPALIDLRKRVTLVIGANNSGKSNVLAGIGLLKEKQGILKGLPQTDVHLRDERNAPRVVADLLVESRDDFPRKAPGDLIRFACSFNAGQWQWLESPLRDLEFRLFNNLFRRRAHRSFTAPPSPEELEKAIAQVSEIFYREALSKLPGRCAVFVPNLKQLFCDEP